MNILFITDFTFPYGTAWSSRARNLYKLFKACGHDVHLIAKYSGSEENKSADGYDVEYVGFNYNSIKAYTIDKCRAYINTINEYVRYNHVDVIVSSKMDYVYSAILKIARKKGIPYVIEQCEWYDVSSFPGGYFNPKYWLYSYNMRWGYARCDGVIAISSYLFNHFSKKVKHVVRIPSIIDITEYEPKLDVNTKDILNVGMCGSLGGSKENIKVVFEALLKVNHEKKRVTYHLYGPSKEEVIKAVGTELYNRCSNYVEIYGRIPQIDVAKRLKELDYTILVRPKRRSSEAGFSTKLVESMAVGVPSICNDTGDISQYIINGFNGVILDDDSADGICCGLTTAYKYMNENFDEIRLNAHLTAIMHFDYTNYIDIIKKYICELSIV